MKPPRVEGHWERAGQGVCGWARCGEEPLWLELLVDDCVVGIGRADLPEPQGCGFWIPLPPIALQEDGTVRVRVANSSEYVGSDVHLAEGESPEVLRGEVCGDGGLTLSGWVVDTLAPKKKVRVTAWRDGEALAETVADARRYDPRLGDGHGFTLHLPTELADGEEHLVSVRDAEGRSLPGGPFPVCALPEGLAGWLERQKRLDGPQRTLLLDMVRRMESRLPHAQGMADYAVWKDVFPVPKVAIRQKCSVRVLICGKGEDELTRHLRRQAGVDWRFDEGRESEYALLLQPGERLQPSAVAHLVEVMRKTGAGVVYADGEGRDADGKPMPLFKPGWDRDAFLGQDYLGPILVSRAVMDEVSCASDESYAALRVRIVLAAERFGIVHIPQLLSEELSVADGEARRTTIQMWLDSRFPGARVEALDDAALSRVRYPLAATPRVSVIIPTRDRADLLQRCLDTLLPTSYGDMEILVVDNGSSAPEALALLDEASRWPRVRVLRWPGAFNYAAINNFAVREASGELVCFLNNDTEMPFSDWLGEMVSLLLAAGEEGGCVGAKLLWPNGLVQHGGVVVGTHQLAAHVGNQWFGDEAGYMNRNAIVQQYSAVTAASLLTSRALFEELGGFDAVRFPVAFNDADYCLRVRAAGKKVLWTPFARLLHHESASRGKDVSTMNRARAAREMQFFRARWGNYDDPFYNPNLPLSTVLEPFAGLALPPRARNIR